MLTDGIQAVREKYTANAVVIMCCNMDYAAAGQSIYDADTIRIGA